MHPDMNLRKIIGIVCLVLCGSLTGKAQTEGWAELAKVRERYTDLSNYSADLNYFVYGGHESQNLLERQSGKIRLFGDNRRFVLGGLETVMNERYLFQLNDDEKELDVLPREQKNAAETPAFADFRAMDELLKKNRALTRSSNGSTSILTFNMKSVIGSEYEKVVLYVTPDGILNKIVLYFAAPVETYALDGDYKPRVEIVYLKQNFAAGLTAADFSEKKYFKVENDRVIPTEAYTYFKLF